MNLLNILAAVTLLIGSGFCLIAAIGVNRFPDLYSRMHAATKAGAFGVALMLLALCLAVPTPRIIIMSVLIVLFFYLTTPVAAQVLGRAGYFRGAKPSSLTGVDELRDNPLPAKNGNNPSSPSRSDS